MSKYIWLIRHSESQGNLERRIQGWKDYPLTTLGRRQAARLAETMAQEEGIEKIYTSPLKRAATTAEIVAAVLGLEVEHDCRLMEYNFGPLNGLTRDEIKAQYPQVWQAWQMNEFWTPLPGEESEQKFEERVRESMDEIVANIPEGGTVAVVMHGGAMNTLVRSWLGIVERGWRTFAFDNASISLVQLQPKIDAVTGESIPNAYNYRMLKLNDASHLGGLSGSKPTWFSASRTAKTGQ